MTQDLIKKHQKIHSPKKRGRRPKNKQKLNKVIKTEEESPSSLEIKQVKGVKRKLKEKTESESKPKRSRINSESKENKVREKKEKRPREKKEKPSREKKIKPQMEKKIKEPRSEKIPKTNTKKLNVNKKTISPTLVIGNIENEGELATPTTTIEKRLSVKKTQRKSLKALQINNNNESSGNIIPDSNNQTSFQEPTSVQKAKKAIQPKITEKFSKTIQKKSKIFNFSYSLHLVIFLKFIITSRRRIRTNQL